MARIILPIIMLSPHPNLPTPTHENPMPRLPLCLLLTAICTPAFAASPAGDLILEDRFERTESDDSKEEVGGGWSTNSKSRAQGVKQVDLSEGALHITRADVADHGVSVVHDLEFRNATIQLKFKIGEKDELGVNIADMKEKSVHAGHICMAKVRTNQVHLMDHKTGQMNLKIREERKSGNPSEATKKLVAAKNKKFKHKVAADEWHDLEVKIAGDVMTVSIDGKQAGEFQSEGIAHPTKRRLRIAVPKQAWIDDVMVWRQ